MTTVAWIVAGVLALTLILVLVQLAELRRQLSAIPRGDDELIGMLQRMDNELGTLFTNAEETNERLEGIEQKTPRNLSQSGVVRYDAFPGMVGNLSRTVAVLDEEGNGYVLSVLVNREESRFYLKAVAGGKGSEPLSPEEAAAVRAAQQR